MTFKLTSFISYNPFIDNKLVVDCIDDGGEKTVPFYLPSAISRAKQLVGTTRIDELRELHRKVYSMVKRGVLIRIGLNHACEKNLPQTVGTSSHLHHYFHAVQNNIKVMATFSDKNKGSAIEIPVDDEIEISDWPKYFGVLALAIAGDIYNELWPTKEYESAVEENRQKNDNYVPSDYEKEWLEKNQIDVEETEFSNELTQLDEILLLQDYACDAMQAVGLGEGLLLAAKHFEQKSLAGAKPSKQHQKLYDKFIAWSIGLPKKHGFKTTEDAVNVGFKQFLHSAFHDENDLSANLMLKSIKPSTHRRLKKVLETYCLEGNIAYPFPRPRSKG